MSHKGFLEMMDRITPLPCSACGVNLRLGIVEVCAGLNEHHSWRVTRSWRGRDWYLDMIESDGAETMGWVCPGCGRYLTDAEAAIFGREIHRAE